MESNTSSAPSTRPTRRRNRNRRGGGGGGGGGGNATGAGTGPLPFGGPSGGFDAPRRRGARKNRRGRQGGAGGDHSNASGGAGGGGMRSIGAQVKVVVRRLPPRLGAESYFADIASRGGSTAIWRSYSAGKKGSRHSTAWLGFADASAAAAFHAKANGARYNDPKGGAEYTARVELAPYQPVPATAYYAGRRPSALHGTIESDSHYTKFLAELQAERAPTTNPTGPVPPKPKPNAKNNVAVSKLMEDVRTRRKLRDTRKGKPAPTTRAGRRRRGRATTTASESTATTSITSTSTAKTTPTLLKKPEPEKLSKKGRAARKRAAAAAAAAGGAAPSPSTVQPAEGDGVYVVRVGRQTTRSLSSSHSVSSAPSGAVGSDSSPSRRKGKSRNTAASSIRGSGPSSPAPRTPIRLLKKEPTTPASAPPTSPAQASPPAP